MTMFSFNFSSNNLVTFLISCFSAFALCAAANRYEAKSGAVADEAHPAEGTPVRWCPATQCRQPVSRPISLYRSGSGSAQAYKPHAPIKNRVCDHEVGQGRIYRVASWPLRRSGYKEAAPSVEFRGRFWVCSSSDKGINSDERSCEAFPISPELAVDTTLEVWQARPDGTYSSLAPGRDEGECRATIVPLKDGTFGFKSVAPGSFGALGGLGPSNFDLPPYGPPSVSLLVRAPGYETMLATVALMPRGSNFRGGDWRGPSMVGARTISSGSKEYLQYITKSQDDGTVLVEVDIFLKALEHEKQELEAQMCPSWMYGLPSSFFTEPIAICAPYLLDFFNL